MDFYTLLLFDVWPAALEFLLHITPNLSRLVIQLMHLDFSGLLQLIETELSLDNCRLLHEMLQLGKCRECLVTPPASLNFNDGQNRSIWSLELVPWILDRFVDLHSVGHA